MALPELADALAGRMAVITLYPLSAVEISKGKNANKNTFCTHFLLMIFVQAKDTIARSLISIGGV